MNNMQINIFQVYISSDFADHFLHLKKKKKQKKIFFEFKKKKKNRPLHVIRKKYLQIYNYKLLDMSNLQAVMAQ